jgi:hypothetical protein
MYIDLSPWTFGWSLWQPRTPSLLYTPTRGRLQGVQAPFVFMWVTHEHVWFPSTKLWQCAMPMCGRVHRVALTAQELCQSFPGRHRDLIYDRLEHITHYFARATGKALLAIWHSVCLCFVDRGSQKRLPLDACSARHACLDAATALAYGIGCAATAPRRPRP